MTRSTTSSRDAFAIEQFRTEGSRARNADVTKDLSAYDSEGIARERKKERRRHGEKEEIRCARGEKRRHGVAISVTKRAESFALNCVTSTGENAARVNEASFSKFATAADKQYLAGSEEIPRIEGKLGGVPPPRYKFAQTLDIVVTLF